MWLTGKRAGKAQRFSVCFGLSLLAAQYRAGKPKIKNNTGRFYWNEYLLQAWRFFLTFISSVFVSPVYLPVCLFSHCLFCVCLYLGFFLFPTLTFTLASSQISCGWVYPSVSRWELTKSYELMETWCLTPSFPEASQNHSTQFICAARSQQSVALVTHQVNQFNLAQW